MPVKLETPFPLVRRIARAPVYTRMRTLDYSESDEIAAVRAAFRLRAAVGSLRVTGPRFPPKRTPWQEAPAPLIIIDGQPAVHLREVTRKSRMGSSTAMLFGLALLAWCVFVLWSGAIFRVG
jgi:hypothetical protein